MTVDRISSKSDSPAASSSDMVLDGLFTGMIGALAVALWFLLLDLMAGRPFYTPALLGAVLLHGAGAASAPVAVVPLAIAAYTAFHFVTFLLFGLLVSYLMTLFERFPIMFFVMLVLLLCQQLAVLGIEVALGAAFIGRLQPWTVVVANLLAATCMAFYQWRRHPNVVRGIDRLWLQDHD